MTGEKTVAELSRELDIAPSVIRNWKRFADAGATAAVQASEDVVPASQLREAYAKIRELERALGRKTMEVEILRAAQEVHARSAELEMERAKWEALTAFSPVGRIVGNTPDPQAVLVEAGEEFQATRLDYCNAAGASILSQPVQPPLVGKQVRVQINRGYVDQLYRPEGQT